MSFGTAVFQKFDTLYSLEKYVRLVYYNTFPLTLYFKVQYKIVHCTANGKNGIKYELQKMQFSARHKKDLLARKKRYHGNPEKKKQTVKKRCHDKSESIR